MIKRTALVLFFLLVLVSSAFAQEDPFEKIDNWAISALSPYKKNVESILKTLGKPLKHETKKESNMHNPGDIDVINTLYYDGLKIISRGAEDGSWFHIVFFESKSSKYKLDGFAVGDNVNKLIKKLGKPSGKNKNSITYETDYTQVAIETEKEKIKAISIFIFLD